MYLGGAPPNTPPCSQWGAFILLITHGGIIGGTPLRWTSFVLSLKSEHRWSFWCNMVLALPVADEMLNPCKGFPASYWVCCPVLK